MTPPVQLVDYVPESVHFDINPAYRLDPEQAESIGQQVEPDVSLDVHWSSPEDLDASESEDETQSDEVLFCTLAVHVNDGEDLAENQAYRIHLQIAGLFQRTAPEALFDEDEGDDYALHTLSSCISMLYGTARSEIASMTSQTPYGKFLLPSISPAQAAAHVLDEEEEEAVANESATDDDQE